MIFYTIKNEKECQMPYSAFTFDSMINVLEIRNNWKFLLLEKNCVTIDLKEWFIQDLKK